MKRLLILLFILVNLSALGQTYTAERIVATRGFYLKDRWVDSIGVDTSMSGEIRSLPSSDAVYRLVHGRLTNLSIPYSAITGKPDLVLQATLDDSTSVLRDSINALRADIASGGGGASLPDQTGNGGKYLTTDGSTTSWGEVSSAPGAKETFSGSTSSTITLATSPADSTKALVFLNGVLLPASDYSIASTTLTLNFTRESADVITVTYPSSTAGGGGSAGTLQEVTDADSTTTRTIIAGGLRYDNGHVTTLYGGSYKNAGGSYYWAVPAHPTDDDATVTPDGSTYVNTTTNRLEWKSNGLWYSPANKDELLWGDNAVKLLNITNWGTPATPDNGSGAGAFDKSFNRVSIKNTGGAYDPYQTLHYRYTSVSAAGTYYMTDRDYDVILVDATAGNVTVVTPSGERVGQHHIIKRVDNSANTVTLSTAYWGNHYIDGGTSVTIPAYGSLEIMKVSHTAGANWGVLTKTF